MAKTKEIKTGRDILEILSRAPITLLITLFAFLTSLFSFYVANRLAPLVHNIEALEVRANISDTNISKNTERILLLMETLPRVQKEVEVVHEDVLLIKNYLLK